MQTGNRDRDSICAISSISVLPRFDKNSKYTKSRQSTGMFCLRLRFFRTWNLPQFPQEV